MVLLVPINNAGVVIPVISSSVNERKRGQHEQNGRTKRIQRTVKPLLPETTM